MTTANYRNWESGAKNTNSQPARRVNSNLGEPVSGADPARPPLRMGVGGNQLCSAPGAGRWPVGGSAPWALSHRAQRWKRGSPWARGGRRPAATWALCQRSWARQMCRTTSAALAYSSRLWRRLWPTSPAAPKEGSCSRCAPWCPWPNTVGEWGRPGQGLEKLERRKRRGENGSSGRKEGRAYLTTANNSSHLIFATHCVKWALYRNYLV